MKLRERPIVVRMRSLRVLLADDEPSNRDVATIMLRSAGHHVVACGDGPEALARCLSEPDGFDVILLDVMMPGLSGLSVAQQLREDARTQKTPIVCVSARARAEDREAGLGAGCDYYLTKPYRRQELLAILAELMEP